MDSVFNQSSRQWMMWTLQASPMPYVFQSNLIPMYVECYKDLWLYWVAKRFQNACRIIHFKKTLAHFIPHLALVLLHSTYNGAISFWEEPWRWFASAQYGCSNDSRPLIWFRLGSWCCFHSAFLPFFFRGIVIHYTTNYSKRNAGSDFIFFISTLFLTHLIQVNWELGPPWRWSAPVCRNWVKSSRMSIQFGCGSWMIHGQSQEFSFMSYTSNTSLRQLELTPSRTLVTITRIIASKYYRTARDLYLRWY
jgi:hypothetical protein